MKWRVQSATAILAFCGLFLIAVLPGSAQSPQYVGGIPGATTGRVTAIVLGTVGVTAGITFGVYEAVQHNHVITGCTRSGPDGLLLTSESDQRTYVVMGQVAAIKPGERVRLAGKTSKAKAPVTRQFLVEKVSKHFGPCEVASSAR